MPRRGFRDREVSDRARDIRAQCLPERSEPERMRGNLFENANTGKQPQHAGECPRIRCDRLCKLVSRLRSIKQSIGDSELRYDTDGLAVPIAGDESHHFDVGECRDRSALSSCPPVGRRCQGCTPWSRRSLSQRCRERSHGRRWFPSILHPARSTSRRFDAAYARRTVRCPRSCGTPGDAMPSVIQPSRLTLAVRAI